jgi:predicted metal-dependent hydrolase
MGQGSQFPALKASSRNICRWLTSWNKGRQNERESEEQEKGWLTHKAEEHLIPWLKRVSDETGLSYSAVSIRQQQTRWGSCSSRRLISLNARLLFLSPDLVTYVLVHELCHTKHLNHSPRFWRLVESYLPDYRQFDRQLRNGGRYLPGWLIASCGRKDGRLGCQQEEP